MRRGFSIVLMLVFGLMPLSVLVDGSEDANLPACCRRHGTHHCSMAMHMAAMMRDAASGKMPVASAPMTCPEYPGLAALFGAPAPALTVTVASLPVLKAQTQVVLADYAAPKSTPARTHAGRGPPIAELS